MQLLKLPEQIGKLHGLVNFKASKNMLSYLPQSIGKLSSLKYLDVSKNNLNYLPGSMKNLRLILLDVSENKFQRIDLYFTCRTSVPSLLELGAREFLKTGFV